MSMIPKLNSKTQELFFLFLSDPAVQNQLNSNLGDIVRGESVTVLSPPLGSGAGGFVQRGRNTTNTSNSGSTQDGQLRVGVGGSGMGSNTGSQGPGSVGGSVGLGAHASRHHSNNIHNQNTPPSSPNVKMHSPRSPRHVNNHASSKGKNKSSVKIVPEDSSLRERDLNIRVISKGGIDKHDGHAHANHITNNNPSKQNKSHHVKLRSEVKQLPVNKEVISSGRLGRGTAKNQDSRYIAGALANIPQFYFPLGKPPGKSGAGTGTHSANELLQDSISELARVFSKLEDGKAYKNNMATVVKACGLPKYWKHLVYRSSGGETQGYVSLHDVKTCITRLYTSYHDDASRFIKLCSAAANNTATPASLSSSPTKNQYLVQEDFITLVQDIVETHPGLSFLQDAPEFHSRYVHTVIARIFYCVNRSWTGRITAHELRQSCLLQTIVKLDEEEDINQISQFFSYEHFYVIYCKFWEIDTDHDLLISKEDLAKHNDHAISSRMIDRIFSGAVTRSKAQRSGLMTYSEFVWFLISEEDKTHPTSIEYWFRCMDLDGDGVLSMYEMEYFYEEQTQKMEALGIETLPYEDCLCQMLDMVSPQYRTSGVTLSDLKRCQMAPVFFDTFFNLDKYLDREQKDPFSNLKDGEDEISMSEWEKYAAEEYEILVAEEGVADHISDGVYEDDFEDDEELSALVDEPLTMMGKAGAVQ